MLRRKYPTGEKNYFEPCFQLFKKKEFDQLEKSKQV